MNLQGLIIFLLVVGIILWVFPVEATIKKIVIGAIAIIALLWMAAALGWISAPRFF